jgi:hypothetical protein
VSSCNTPNNNDRISSALGNAWARRGGSFRQGPSGELDTHEALQEGAQAQSGRDHLVVSPALGLGFIKVGSRGVSIVSWKLRTPWNGKERGHEVCIAF